MENKYLSRILYPETLSSTQQPSFLVGWNTENFQCIISLAIPKSLLSLGELSSLLTTIYESKSHSFSKKYGLNNYPPIVLGEIEPNKSMIDYTSEGAHQQRTIWLKLTTRASSSELFSSTMMVDMVSIYSLGCRYDTYSYLISYPRPNTSNLVCVADPKGGEDMAVLAEQMNSGYELEQLLYLQLDRGEVEQHKRGEEEPSTSRPWQVLHLFLYLFLRGVQALYAYCTLPMSYLSYLYTSCRWNTLVVSIAAAAASRHQQGRGDAITVIHLHESSYFLYELAEKCSLYHRLFLYLATLHILWHATPRHSLRRALYQQSMRGLCQLGWDLLLGYAAAALLYRYGRSLALPWIEDLLTLGQQQLLDLLAWFNNSPGGIKLNPTITRKVGGLLRFFLVHCSRFLALQLAPYYRPIAPSLLLALGLGGAGFSLQLALVLDLLRLASYPVTLLHILCSHLFASLVSLLASLWLLFKGQKTNVLRGQRVDSMQQQHYDASQLTLGVMLFAMLFFSLPNLLAYHLLFLAARGLLLLCLYLVWQLGIIFLVKEAAVYEALCSLTGYHSWLIMQGSGQQLDLKLLLPASTTAAERSSDPKKQKTAAIIQLQEKKSQQQQQQPVTAGNSLLSNSSSRPTSSTSLSSFVPQQSVPPLPSPSSNSINRGMTILTTSTADHLLLEDFLFDMSPKLHRGQRKKSSLGSVSHHSMSPVSAAQTAITAADRAGPRQAETSSAVMGIRQRSRRPSLQQLSPAEQPPSQEDEGEQSLDDSGRTNSRLDSCFQPLHQLLPSEVEEESDHQLQLSSGLAVQEEEEEDDVRLSSWRRAADKARQQKQQLIKGSNDSGLSSPDTSSSHHHRYFFPAMHPSSRSDLTQLLSSSTSSHHSSNHQQPLKQHTLQQHTYLSFQPAQLPWYQTTVLSPFLSNYSSWTRQFYSLFLYGSSPSSPSSSSRSSNNLRQLLRGLCRCQPLYMTSMLSLALQLTQRQRRGGGGQGQGQGGLRVEETVDLLQKMHNSVKKQQLDHGQGLGLGLGLGQGQQQRTGKVIGYLQQAWQGDFLLYQLPSSSSSYKVKKKDDDDGANSRDRLSSMTWMIFTAILQDLTTEDGTSQDEDEMKQRRIWKQYDVVRRRHVSRLFFLFVCLLVWQALSFVALVLTGLALVIPRYYSADVSTIQQDISHRAMQANNAAPSNISEYHPIIVNSKENSYFGWLSLRTVTGEDNI